MPKSSPLAIALTSLFALLCVTSAALQYNDPDPLRWIAIYLAGGVSAMVAILRRPLWWAALLVALAAVIWGTNILMSIIDVVELSDLWRKMSEKGGHAEELREAIGLFIVTTGCTTASTYARGKGNAPIRFPL